MYYLHVFLTSSVELVQFMDALRLDRRKKSVICIQRWTRGYLARKNWAELKVSLLQAKRQKEANQSFSKQGSDLNPYEVSGMFSSGLLSLQLNLSIMNPGYNELPNIIGIDLRMYTYLLYCKWTLM